MTGFNNNQKRPKGIKLFKTLALVGFMIDIATFGAIFIVLGHDAGGPQECTSTNGLCVPGTSLLCTNPPPNNPNACHTYNWINFPFDVGVTPKTGLFNNDTSYIFSRNMTSVLSYTMCANVQSDTGLNDTLVLQYFAISSLTFVNIDTGVDAGSVPLSGQVYPTTICSLQLGYVPATLTSLCGTWPGGSSTGCSLRIAGNNGNVPNGAGSGRTVVLSELFVQFFFTSFSARNTITCSATARSTTQFTNTCGRILSTVADSLTVAWEANNLGVTFQSGSVTCSFALGSGTCTNVITFSPAFAATPSVLEQQSKVIGAGTVSGGGSDTIPILS